MKSHNCDECVFKKDLMWRVDEEERVRHLMETAGAFLLGGAATIVLTAILKRNRR